MITSDNMDQKKSVYEKPSLTKYGKLKDLTLIKKFLVLVMGLV